MQSYENAKYTPGRRQNNDWKLRYEVTATKEGSGTEDIKKRLSKAQEAFFNLMKIWNTRSIGRNTKIKLFKTLRVRPVLLYRCQVWKLTAQLLKRNQIEFNSHI